MHFKEPNHRGGFFVAINIQGCRTGKPYVRVGSDYHKEQIN